MKYNLGQTLHGFQVEQSRHIREIGGDLYILRHIHSGAMLCYIDNDDRNMTYSVTFATPSHDSTGVFHILEHSVLCGSDKYPVDDPFVELMKSSLYTFLNAMTFPDKTMYPVSSMNEKDLMNLMSVYTDAVFRPLIYRDETAFRQEGWHIETDENGKPYYQGVVYNEMKGALGDPDETLYQAIFGESYEPCQYTTVSGGHPDHIVRLTYEDFINNHKKYYHPSNARFYLYGKMHVESKLAFLDDEYLSKVAPQEAVREPKITVKRQASPYRCTYAADGEKSGEDYIALTYPIGEMPDFTTYLGLSVLTDILADTNYDPLKKRILDKGLAVELDCEMIEDIAYPLFTVKLRHCDAGRLDEIEREITSCLTECAAGLDREAVKAKLSAVEFNLREGSAAGLTKGLYYNIQIADTWLYDYEPWRYLEYEAPLAAIKENLDKGYFENLIQTALLDNENRNIVVMTPCAEGNHYSEPDSADENISDRVETEQEPAEAPDPIPHLSIGDVDQKAVPFPTTLKEKDGKPYLFHDLKTDGIVYADLFFDIGDADDDELFTLSVLSSLLTNIATAKKDGQTLQTKLGLYTGAMDMTGAVGSYQGRVISSAVLRFKALTERYEKAVGLAQEILTQTVFTDQKSITDIIGQMVTELQLGFINNSSQLAAARAAATHNIHDAISDKTGGIDFYLRLKGLKESLDNDPEGFDRLRASLEAAYEKFIKNGRAVYSLACDEESYQAIKDVALPMQALLTNTLSQANTALLSGNLALAAPCDIVFNGYSYNIEGDVSGGSLMLAKKILSLEYLWQRIRVENGAYGCGTIPNASRRLDMWSYRDPQIRATLNTFDEAAEFLSRLQLTDRALEDYIISVVRTLDNPRLPRANAYLSSVYYLLGRDQDVIQRERDELLRSTLADLNQIGDKLKADAQNAAYCTVGNAAAIEGNKALYDEIVKL
ncbi:insulinase family protein [Ruminococcus sp.]|uniref:insulinase family protein n=1 Tax=Ruminococcus sp. TaxID=41978 RepID=UPI00388EC798